jgi:hypothetical protein
VQAPGHEPGGQRGGDTRQQLLRARHPAQVRRWRISCLPCPLTASRSAVLACQATPQHMYQPRCGACGGRWAGAPRPGSSRSRVCAARACASWACFPAARSSTTAPSSSCWCARGFSRGVGGAGLTRPTSVVPAGISLRNACGRYAIEEERAQRAVPGPAHGLEVLAAAGAGGGESKRLVVESPWSPLPANACQRS